MIESLKKYLQTHFVFLVLLFGFLHGLAYVFLIPPWQHYDETGHFEYAWMIANRDSIPQKGDYDNQIRSEILNSMKENKFFLYQGQEDLLLDVDKIDPVWIGITQVGDPPLYYLLVSLPLKILKKQSIEVQLYFARMVSLGLYLVILWIAILFSRDIFSGNHPGSYLFPLTLSMIPSFVDHMTALNNDVAAVTINSLIFLLGVRVVKYGITWRRGILIGLAGILVYFVKASVWLSIILVGLVFLYFLFKRKPKLSFVIVGSLLILFLLAVFQIGDTALWYKNSNQIEYTNISTEHGSALFLNNDQNNQNSWLVQTIPPKYYADLAGKVVTLGATVWGNNPDEFIPFSLMVLTDQNEIKYINGNKISLPFLPQFYAKHIQLPDEFFRLYVVFRNKGDGELFIKEPILVLGEFPINANPTYFNNKNSEGEWNHLEFNNLIRNASLTGKWLSFRPQTIQIMADIDPRLSEAANKIIYSLDLKGTSWYLKETAYRVFRTFWAVFGWGNVIVIGHKPYRIMGIFTLLSLGVSFMFFVRHRFKINHYLLFWFVLSLLFSGLYAWFTGISMNSYFGKAYLPVARFIYPAIFPIILVLVYGWAELINGKTAFVNKILLLIYFTFFIYLDIISILSITQYF